jgi:hypothetical protein
MISALLVKEEFGLLTAVASGRTPSAANSSRANWRVSRFPTARGE